MFWVGFWNRADSGLFTEVPPTHTPCACTHRCTNICMHVPPCSLRIPHFSLLFLFALLSPSVFSNLTHVLSCKQASPVFPGHRYFSFFGALRVFISVPSWHETNHCLDLFSHSASFPEKIHDTPRAKMSPPLQIMPLSCLRISGGPLWPIALLP